MITVLESIKLSTDFFEKKGIESPRANAEILLAHVLKCKRLDLYLAFDKPLKDEELNQYREYLKRRARFEPIQYIIGEVEFYGLTFKVQSPVLIPRPETEIFIDSVLSEFTKDNKLRFLDIGTGTGIIPITLAKHFPEANFTAIDTSKEALSIAAENAELNGVAERIEFLNKDILVTGKITEMLFDVILANPPYVSINEYETLQPEILDYESKNAITDNADGYTFYRAISEKAASMLKSNGYLFYEMGKGQFEEIKKIMQFQCFEDIVIKKDYLNIERVIYGVKR